MPDGFTAETLLTLHRDGLTLSARHFGDRGAPLAVVLHGFPDTPHSFDGLIPTLLDAGYQVLAPWLRGYTHGSAVRSARYDVLAAAADITAWREELGAPPAHLIGHDWGAFVALVLAKQAPAQWVSLTMLAIPPFGDGFLPALLPLLPRQMMMSFYIPIMQAGASHRLLTRADAAFVRALWRRWSPGWEFSQADFAPTAAVFTDPLLAWAATRYYRSMLALHRSATREFHRLLTAPAAPLPTLVLAGARDGALSAKLQRLVAEGAGAAHAELPECGHFLHAEDPAGVAARLLPHLAAAAH
ncbi:alpha/beta hydrolase [Nocardia sp. 2]|uniref:Alpha/beta hydrolase n=1 Tax=Nocardia acididurans TaxID=2802282 RepID=A0ABS1MAB0_9NOCA|nr:alpha/beta hydrolase [Nocardia acididurans]MBL1076980.1 alpha/beta hydrolase [Nocardia acididurans]